MWSELGSVIILSHQVVQQSAVLCTMYILWGSDSVLLLSQGELVDRADSSLSQRRAVTCGGEHPDHHPGVLPEDIKIKTCSPVLNQ